MNAAQVSERGSKVAETSTIGQRGSRPTNEDVFEKNFLVIVVLEIEEVVVVVEAKSVVVRCLVQQGRLRV